VEKLSDLEILQIITDDKDSYSSSDVKNAQRIAEQRGLDVYLYINDRDAYLRLSTKKAKIDDRAPLRLRFINFLVDSFTIIIIAYLMSIIVKTLGSDHHDYNLKTYSKLWSVLLTFAYYAILEGFWNKTLGKVITGTTVVSQKNKKPTSKEILLRTLWRFVPLEPLSFLFAKDGFHDIYSKTKVISKKYLVNGSR
tara:strand:- start:583 stop:1167 length:585 start_codon:yes stop_codon:yes gene_type:complete